MHTLFGDLRHAARRLKSSPAFTSVAVITLGLGIAATTAIYSVVDALMLRPLPYRDPGRLVEIITANEGGMFLPMAADRLEFWRSQRDIFQDVEAYSHRSAVASGGAEPQTLIGAALTGGTMRMLGIGPRLGRGIEERDTIRGNEFVIVLSDTLWRTRFGTDPDVVSKTVRLDDQTYTVIGVMPPEFTFPYGRRQFWVPLVIDPANPRAARLNVTARIRDDLTVPEARTRVETVARGLAGAGQLQPGLTMRLDPPLARHLNPPVRRALIVLAGAVALVLLIACANVANLLLVQGAGREREMGIRSALGASRPRLVRQLVTETLLLAATGGAVGLLLGQWMIDLVAALTPREMTFLNVHTIALNGRVLAFEIGVTIVTAMLFGVLPALRATGKAPREALADTRASTAGPRQERLRRAFVLAQVALSLVLLVGAGLMARTFAHITRVDPGFDPENVIAVDLSLPRWKYPTRAAQQQFFEEVSARVRNLPAVRATSLTGGVPPGGGGISFGLKFEIEGRGVVLDDPELLMPFTEADGNYFETMGIPIKAGRTFAAEDTPEAPRVVIINEDMARRLWKDENPVGRRIRFDRERPWYTVIGVAGDVYQFRHDMTDGVFAVYYANTQSRGIPAQQTLVIRASQDPMPLIPEIRQLIWSIDPDQPILRIESIEAAYAQFFSTPRFYAFLMSTFALLGLVISTVGLYGVLAYAVAQRTREFGIRTALGAQKTEIMRLAARTGILLTATGIVTGLLASIGLAGAMESLLVDIQPTDPLTYAATIALLAVASLTACWIPAHRATRVDPIVALRHE